MDYAVFSDGNRRRSPKYAKTKAEANVLKGQLEEVERATKTRLAAKRDVDAWIERGWLKLEEALSIFEGYAETVADQLLFSTDYDAILDAFEEYSGQTCKGGFGGRQHIKNGSQARKVINWLASASPNISDLTVEMIHQKLNEMRTSYTDWSLHHFLQKMKLLLDHAVKLNMLHENPARKISLRKDLNVRMKIATVRRILTLNEIDVLLESSLQYPDLLNGSLPVIVRVGLYAGFRNEEVSWFDWNWIDWDTGILDMQATTCQANGENWVPKDYETRRLDVKDACIDYLRFEKKRQAKAGLLGQFVIPSGSKRTAQ